MTQPFAPSAQDLEQRGDALLAAGEAQPALEAFSQAARLAPELGRLQAKRGSALLMLGAVEDAIAAFTAAREALPNSPAVWTNLGSALTAADRLEEALAALRRAVELRPDYAIGLYNLGRALAQGGDLKGALEAFESAAIADPGSAAAHVALGQTHLDLGQVDKAVACLNVALARDPRSSEAYMNLGYIAQHAKDVFGAMQLYEQALACDPRNGRAAANLASMRRTVSRWKESREIGLRAIALDPSSAVLRSNFLFGLDFDPALTPGEIFAAHREYETFMPSAPARPALAPRLSGRIRVGYVSADFRTHACAHFLLPLLRAHDPSQFEVICYSNSKIEDAITDSFKQVAARWRPIHHLRDDAAARLIAGDEIDILVDCSGHTDCNRLGVFARRPARYSLSWLGYGNTTGLKAIGYRMTDEVLDPVSEGNVFATEKLIRLPRGFMTYDPLTTLPDLAMPPHVSNGHLTFGSFNGLSKINPDTVATWCRILTAVPGSRLLLKDRHFDFDNVRAMMLELITAGGVTPDRCELRGFTLDRSGHLAVMNEVDICLDTHPYGGNTTTCDAVVMGVPVVTQYGNRYTARQTASILAHLGLDDLIARNAGDYVRIAVSLAGNRDLLADLRMKLRNKVAATTIGDPRAFASDVEAAYKAIIEGAA